MKTIGILGSTGSIGMQALEIIKNNNQNFSVDYLYSNSNYKTLYKQILDFSPSYACINDEESYKNLSELVGPNSDTKIIFGSDNANNFISSRSVDLVLNAIVGIDGLKPTMAVINNNIDIALSNKESLVLAGEIVMNKAKNNNVNIFPVDSEHSAIWQCLKGEKEEDINKIILTASGGPFRSLDYKNFSSITVKDALNHPNWKMGNKITIDSATMMNKGLEVIEAYWLFDMNIDQIEIIIHPQSIIHSMVEFNDGSVKAQLGLPNMKIPIQYALTYPNHLPGNWESLDLINIGSISFEKPDLEKFPCIRLSYEALQVGGSFPIVLNIANDTAVAAFLNKHIQFNDIPRLIEEALNKHTFIKEPNMKNIFELSQWTESYIHNEIAAIA